MKGGLSLLPLQIGRHTRPEMDGINLSRSVEIESHPTRPEMEATIVGSSITSIYAFLKNVGLSIHASGKLPQHRE